jgi:hypothetical protein
MPIINGMLRVAVPMFLISVVAIHPLPDVGSGVKIYFRNHANITMCSSGFHGG